MDKRRSAAGRVPVVRVGVLLLTLAGSCLTAATLARAGGATPEDGEAMAAGDHRRTFTHDGRTRIYRIHLPPLERRIDPLPVVLAFHGGGTNARLMMRTTDLIAVSDREGFAVVFPEGTGRFRRLLTWNAGRCCAYAQRKGVDDVGAVAALLDDLSRIVPVDPRRVYATGISNGAMMSYRLACELSDRIAAIAPVAGTMNLDRCEPARPVPVVHFHGTADEFCPYGGGVGPRSVSSGGPRLSVEDNMRLWREFNGCTGEPVTARLPDREEDQTTVVRTAWGSCRGDSEVVLYTIEGGGHTWPGAVVAMRGVFGASTRDVSASEVMWDFFRNHPLPEPAAPGAP